MPEAEEQTGGDPALAALIDALSGDGQLDAGSLLRAHIERGLPDNPQTALVLRLMERQQQMAAQRRAEAETEAQAEGGEDDNEQDGAAEKQRAFEELQEKIERVYAELESLRTRNAELALALGACPLCFGEDPLCEECGGRGSPGANAPEPDAFRKYVLPAWRLARQIETRQAGPPRRADVR